jgi:hypothetical protein
VPRILNETELAAVLELLRNKSPAAILIGNIGILPVCSEFNVPMFMDYSLNTFNDIDIQFFNKYDITPLISPELSLAELSQFKIKDAVIFCHGDIALMNTKIDPKTTELVDEKGSKFCVRKEDDYWQILNSRPYGVFDDIHTLVKQGYTQFYIDRQGRGADSVRLYRTLLAHGVVNRRARRGYTSGHLYKPVD